MSMDMLLRLAEILVMGGAIYGGIRSDIKAIHEGLKETREEVKEARARIDNLLMMKGGNHG